VSPPNGVHGSAVVRLADDAAPSGLYVGRVADAANGIDVPYTIYKSDVPPVVP